MGSVWDVAHGLVFNKRALLSALTLGMPLPQPDLRALDALVPFQGTPFNLFLMFWPFGYNYKDSLKWVFAEDIYSSLHIRFQQRTCIFIAFE